jgi:hypothetical protein
LLNLIPASSKAFLNAEFTFNVTSYNFESESRILLKSGKTFSENEEKPPTRAHSFKVFRRLGPGRFLAYALIGKR